MKVVVAGAGLVISIVYESFEHPYTFGSAVRVTNSCEKVFDSAPIGIFKDS